MRTVATLAAWPLAFGALAGQIINGANIKPE
jgi:hypothetical protein